MNYIILLIWSILGVNLSLIKFIAKAQSPEQIIGGDIPNTGALKYLVAILADGEYECTGGILDDMLIVGAAHCIIDKDAFDFYQKSFEVVVTSNFLSPEATITSALVQKVYLPLEFDLVSFSRRSIYDLKHDIVIFKLEERLGIHNPLLRALQLPETSSLHSQNSYVTASYGFHELSEDGTRLAKDGKLRYADADIISNDECSRLNNETIENFLLCARVKQIPERIRGVCKGDSGSPLVQNGQTIIGILVLTPISCSEEIFAGIYIRISYYSEFIENAKRGDTRDMRTFSIVETTPSRYTFIADSPTICYMT